MADALVAEELGAARDAAGRVVRLSLPNSGEDENEMRSFFQQYLVGILRPINAHVDELQKQLQQLVQDHGLTGARTRNLAERLDGQEQKFAALSSETCAAVSSLDEAYTRISEFQNQLLGGRTAADYARETAAVAMRVAELEKASGEHGTSLQGLSRAMGEARTMLDHMDCDISSLKHFTESLNERQLDLVRDAQKANQSRTNADKALAKFMADFERHKKESEKSHAQSDERYRTLHAMIDDTHNVVRVQGTQLKKAEAHIKKLADLVAATRQNSDKSARRLETLLARANVLEDQATSSGRALTVQAEQLRNLQSWADETGSHVGRLEAESQLAGRERGELGSQVAALEKLCTGDLGPRQEQLAVRMLAAESNVQALTELQREASSDAEARSLQLHSLEERVKHNSQGLGNALKGLENNDAQLGVMKHDVARIDEGLELAHRYLQGLGKGVQDTHRRVAAGQDGMLAPKVPASSALPSLPSRRHSTVEQGAPRGPESHRPPAT